MRDSQKRPKMMPSTDSMRAWALAVSREIEAWPGVRFKTAFGMTLAYRNGTVFAALPRTRALYEEDAILIKFSREPPSLCARIRADRRFAAGTMEQRRTSDGRKPNGEGRKWRIFVMRVDADVHAAIEWLNVAYQQAVRTKRQARV